MKLYAAQPMKMHTTRTFFSVASRPSFTAFKFSHGASVAGTV